jgi:hypothetical protein
MTPYDLSAKNPVGKAHAELRFLPRCEDMRRLVFQCDAAGHVDIDELSEHERIEYLFARALRGRDYSLAIVTTSASHGGLSA